ncbi:uncharacterized protein CLAFUR5_09168 [Fulvia fulva]|uniref:Uncharacterized protein n=1 Tax=Passalora fulva TaxID=5499 RepID=A0A9Q8PGB0_PASFU|nr:uncharacterized protein CLAFUR5_09168 [Fulvia fulva]UJO21890.1 hypothetical protein CLAFUR5_09168 [Fulvia fulva]
MADNSKGNGKQHERDEDGEDTDGAGAPSHREPYPGYQADLHRDRQAESAEVDRLTREHLVRRRWEQTHRQQGRAQYERMRENEVAQPNSTAAPLGSDQDRLGRTDPIIRPPRRRVHRYNFFDGPPESNPPPTAPRSCLKKRRRGEEEGDLASRKRRMRVSFGDAVITHISGRRKGEVEVLKLGNGGRNSNNKSSEEVSEENSDEDTHPDIQDLSNQVDDVEARYNAMINSYQRAPVPSLAEEIEGDIRNLRDDVAGLGNRYNDQIIPDQAAQASAPMPLTTSDRSILESSRSKIASLKRQIAHFQSKAR